MEIIYAFNNCEKEWMFNSTSNFLATKLVFLTY